MIEVQGKIFKFIFSGCAIFLLNSCVSLFMPQFIKEEKAMSKVFVKTHPQSFSNISYGQRSIHFVSLDSGVGSVIKPKIIFVHGSPGSWEHFVRQLNEPSLQSSAFLLAPDRLGYGGSDQGHPERSLDHQAQALMGLLDQGDPQAPVVLVGHSYGGPVVARMAMSGDPRIKSVILLAGALDPSLEQTKWYQTAAELGVFRWMVPTDLVTCNREILALKPELERIKPDWSKIKARVIVLQGMKDELVDPKNAEFIQTMIPSAKITRIPNAGHVLPAYEQDQVLKLIQQELKAL